MLEKSKAYTQNLITRLANAKTKKEIESDSLKPEEGTNSFGQLGHTEEDSSDDSIPKTSKASNLNVENRNSMGVNLALKAISNATDYNDNINPNAERNGNTGHGSDFNKPIKLPLISSTNRKNSLSSRIEALRNGLSQEKFTTKPGLDLNS